MLEAVGKIDDAVASVPAGSGDLDQVAKALGGDLGATMDPITPLAASRDEADAEVETKSLTKAKKLGDLVEKKLEKILDVDQ